MLLTCTAFAISSELSIRICASILNQADTPCAKPMMLRDMRSKQDACTGRNPGRQHIQPIRHAKPVQNVLAVHSTRWFMIGLRGTNANTSGGTEQRSGNMLTINPENTGPVSRCFAIAYDPGIAAEYAILFSKPSKNQSE